MNRLQRYRHILLVLAAMLVTRGIHAGDDPQDAPTTGLPPELPRVMSEQIERLGHNDFEHRCRAQKALGRIVEGAIERVARHPDYPQDEAAEIKTRLMRRIEMNLRREAMLMALAPDTRRTFIAAAGKHPDDFAALFGARPAVAAKALARLADAEPGIRGTLCVWGLEQSAYELGMAGLKLVDAMKSPPEPVTDALFRRAVTRLGRSCPERETKATLKILQRLKDPRLVDLLLEGGRWFRMNHMWMSDAWPILSTIKDRRMVPSLIDHIDNERGTSHGNVVGTSGDMYMALVIVQSGQSLKDYGMVVDNNKPGFRAKNHEKRRTAAQIKLRQWWKKNAERYKGVPRIAVEETRRMGMEGCFADPFGDPMGVPFHHAPAPHVPDL